MQNSIKTFIVFIFILSSFRVLSQSDPRFYQAISGTYLDERSGEIVNLVWTKIGGMAPFNMYYQVNEQQAPQKTKIMEELAKDVNRLWMKVKFYKSNYICEFTFTPDFEGFTCKNPDGSQQVFKRNPLPARQPFSRFVGQFPAMSLSQPIDITQIPKQGKPIPVEWAIKYLVNQDRGLSKELIFENDEAKTQEQKMDYKRCMMLGKFVNRAGFRSIRFYYVGRITLSDRFISVLFRAKGNPHFEAGFEDLYLANFSKTGKLLGLQGLSYTMFNYIYSSTKATSTLTKSSIKIEAVTDYGKSMQALVMANESKKGKDKKVEKALEEHCTTIYRILPSGRIERQQRFFDDVLGKFHDQSYYPMCVVQKTAEGEFKALYITRQGEKEKTVQLKLIKFDPTTYRLDLKNKKDGQIWKLQFNPSKTSVTITRPNQHSLVLIR